MQEINLLQTRVKDTASTWQKQSRAGLIAITLVLVAILAAGGGIYLLRQNTENKIKALNAENQSLQSELKEKYSNLEEAKAFQAQLVNVDTLLQNHKYSSALFDEISSLTYQRSRYLNITVTEA